MLMFELTIDFGTGSASHNIFYLYLLSLNKINFAQIVYKCTIIYTIITQIAVLSIKQNRNAILWSIWEINLIGN